MQDYAPQLDHTCRPHRQVMGVVFFRTSWARCSGSLVCLLMLVLAPNRRHCTLSSPAIGLLVTVCSTKLGHRCEPFTEGIRASRRHVPTEKAPCESRLRGLGPSQALFGYFKPTSATPSSAQTQRLRGEPCGVSLGYQPDCSSPDLDSIGRITPHPVAWLHVKGRHKVVAVHQHTQDAMFGR